MGFKKDLQLRIGKREFISSKKCNLHPSMIHSLKDNDLMEINELYHLHINENGKEASIRQQKEINHYRDYFPLSKDISFLDLCRSKEMEQYEGFLSLFKIISTITVTNSTAERNFSKLKFIKTLLRNRQSDANLSNETLISIKQISQNFRVRCP